MRTVPIDFMSSSIFLRQWEVGPMQNFVYGIGDPKARQAVVVDPAWEVDLLLKKIEEEGYDLTGVLVTHGHFDHVNGLGALLKRKDIPVYVHEKEAPYMRKESASNIKKVKNEDEIKVGEVTITFLHTPGHTPGSQCFLVGPRLISGDTLFIGYCGRCDLPGGNAEEMYESLTKKLMKLPPETVLYPGHNYAERPTSTIEEEIKTNPYLACRSLAEFLEFRMRVT